MIDENEGLNVESILTSTRLSFENLLSFLLKYLVIAAASIKVLEILITFDERYENTGAVDHRKDHRHVPDSSVDLPDPYDRSVSRSRTLDTWHNKPIASLYNNAKFASIS